MSQLRNLLDQAIQHHRGGRYAEAEQAYQQILQHDPQHVDALHLMGLIAHQTGRTEWAMTCIKQAILLKPDFAEAHYNLGVILISKGQPAEAVESYRRALAVKPDYAEAHNNLGDLLREQGHLEAARQHLAEAVRLKPDFAEAHNNLGNVLLAEGQAEQARACFVTALQLRPDFAKAHNNIGNALKQLGRSAEARQSYQEAIRLNPDFAEAHNNLGNLLRQQGDLNAAADSYRQALHCKPDFAEVHANLGLILKEQGQLSEAVASYREALRLKPAYPEALNNLGNLFKEQGQLADAVANYEQALRLAPDSAEAHNNLANALKEQGKLDDAVAHYHEALRHKTDFAEGYNNLGNALKEQGKLDEALQALHEAVRLAPELPEGHNSLGGALLEKGELKDALVRFDRALELQPDLAAAHLNRAIVLLLQGDLPRGWPEYEWRWKCKPPTPVRRQPLWDGSPLSGRTIMLWSEQGLGDTIQFVRYASLVKDKGGRVILTCQPVLAPLLARCPGVDQVVAQGSAVSSPIDVHAPLLSLPGMLGTTLDNIPGSAPYLTPDAGKVAGWRRRLEACGDFKIGIAWQGNPKHKGDRLRSVHLTQFAPLGELPGVQLFSLQKGTGSEQLAGVEAAWRPIDLGNQLDGGSMEDAAALLVNLDLVVTVDTAIAHLAGALAVPVWVALPLVPDWRWLLGRSDSLWYPTMRLFRQGRRGDWPGVFEGMVAALQPMLRNRARRRPLPMPISPVELVERIVRLEIEREGEAHDGAELDRLRSAGAWALEDTADLLEEARSLLRTIRQVEHELLQTEEEDGRGDHIIDLVRTSLQHQKRWTDLQHRLQERLVSSSP